MNTITCAGCGKPHEYEPVNMGGPPRFPTQCASCTEAEWARIRHEREAAIHADRWAQWRRICPALYRGTERDHPAICKSTLAQLSSWNPRNANGMGLYISGESGRCKTRMALLRLCDLHMAGERIHYVNATEFARACVEQFSDDSANKKRGAEVLQNCKKASVLLFDDIGAARFTERSVAEIFDLTESRTSNLRPTLWTSNLAAGELEARLVQAPGGEDNFRVARRIFEFAEVITIPLATREAER